MHRIALLLAVVASLLAGCAASRYPGLDGTEWTLTGWSADTSDPVRFRVSAEFDDGRMAGKAPINRYTSPYKQTRRGGLTFMQPVSTMMAGDEDFMRGEQTFFDLLARVRSFRRETGVLIMSDDTGKTLLVFSPPRK
jgi:heat shock protein HslJ